MEVTIEAKEVVTATSTKKIEHYQEGLFQIAKTCEVEVPGEPIITFEVHLTLIPSEEERAIIHKYRLGELIVEEEPHFSDTQIEEQRALVHIETDSDLKIAHRRTLEEMRKSKTIYRFANYFDNPFVRTFPHPKGAHKYVDKLKEEVLPIIKSNIDYFGARTEKETFTL